MLGLVLMECKQVREINLCACGYQLSLSLYYCTWHQRAATCLWAASKEPSRGQSLCFPLAWAMWLVWTCGRKFDTFLFLEEWMWEQGERKGEAGNLAPFKGALIISCTKSKSPQVSHIVTWNMGCLRPTVIAQLPGEKCFTCLWGHVKWELPPVHC